MADSTEDNTVTPEELTNILGANLGGSFVDEDGNLKRVYGKGQELRDDLIIENELLSITEGSVVTTPENILAQLINGTDDLPRHTHAGDDEAEGQPFIGGKPDFQWMPEDYPTKANDPLGKREFVANEFPRMLMYGRPDIKITTVDTENGPQKTYELIEKAKPAFHSLFPAGTPFEKMNVLKVNIATRIPDYMKRGRMANSMAGLEGFGFENKKFEDVFSSVKDNEKVMKAYRKFAEDYETQYGLKIDFRFDDAPDAHAEEDVNITVFGFSGGNPRLAGVGCFPEDRVSWYKDGGALAEEDRQYPLDGRQGYCLLNVDYCNRADRSIHDIYDLIIHEGGGHNMGLVHPHDLAEFKQISPKEALVMTVMAYTDVIFNLFEGTKGLIAGVLDSFMRFFMPNRPSLNEADGIVYDLQAQFDIDNPVNSRSSTLGITRQLPAIPIINNGKGAVLIGTEGNDVLDTEPGHLCAVKNINLNLEQRFCLVEGHFEVVKGRSGNNTIYTSRYGKQDIYPGYGKNEVHVYEANENSLKTIHSVGVGHNIGDVLVLDEELFINKPDVRVEAGTGANKADLIFKTADGEPFLVLKDQLTPGKGVEAIRVANSRNKENGFSIPVVSFTSPQAFEEELLEAVYRQVAREIDRRAINDVIAGEEHRANEHNGMKNDACASCTNFAERVPRTSAGSYTEFVANQANTSAQVER